MKLSALSALSSLAVASAWLPFEKPDSIFERSAPSSRLTGRKLPTFSGKIRGVNLGAWLVSEYWMMGSEWTTTMGCGSTKSEFDCVSALGQSVANTNFQNHYASWITQSDLKAMKAAGLNTIRIPVGYWIYEDMVLPSEHFPQGGLKYLAQMCDWAATLGFYIIIDLHGAPYAQAYNTFTGQLNPNPGFYSSDGFARAEKFWTWMTNLIHTDNRFRNVGMAGVLNEPIEDHPSTTATMISDYYPNVLKTIRQAESGFPASSALHVQYMDQLWRSGNPKQNLPADNAVAFSDHNYIKYANPGPNPQDYVTAACNADRLSDGDTPKVVDEFSLAVADSLEKTSPFLPNDANKDNYSRFFSAQIQKYEKTNGWVFWSWRAELNDYRWSYQLALKAGVIPSNIDTALNRQVC